MTNPHLRWNKINKQPSRYACWSDWSIQMTTHVQEIWRNPLIILPRSARIKFPACSLGLTWTHLRLRKMKGSSRVVGIKAGPSTLHIFMRNKTRIILLSSLIRSCSICKPWQDFDKHSALPFFHHLLSCTNKWWSSISILIPPQIFNTPWTVPNTKRCLSIINPLLNHSFWRVSNMNGRYDYSSCTSLPHVFQSLHRGRLYTESLGANKTRATLERRHWTAAGLAANQPINATDQGSKSNVLWVGVVLSGMVAKSENTCKVIKNCWNLFVVGSERSYLNSNSSLPCVEIRAMVRALKVVPHKG
jgi:hypothetical protein